MGIQRPGAGVTDAVPTALMLILYLLLIVPGDWRVLPSALLLLLALYFWSITTLIPSILRHMRPAMGFLMIFAAVENQGVVPHSVRFASARTPRTDEGSRSCLQK